MYYLVAGIHSEKWNACIILPLCERHRACLHAPNQHSLLYYTWAVWHEPMGPQGPNRLQERERRWSTRANGTIKTRELELPGATAGVTQQASAENTLSLGVCSKIRQLRKPIPQHLYTSQKILPLFYRLEKPGCGMTYSRSCSTLEHRVSRSSHSKLRHPPHSGQNLKTSHEKTCMEQFKEGSPGALPARG